MAYRVKTTPRAENDLAGLYERIGAEHLKQAILSLQEQPNRCPVTPESDRLRHLLYGHKPHIHRVIYRVLEKQKEVEVLHIRHGARKEFTSEESCRKSDLKRGS